MNPRVILAVALALLLLVFVIQNTEIVTVTLLFWDVELSLVVLILLASATGFICGYVVARFRSAGSGGGRSIEKRGSAGDDGR